MTISALVVATHEHRSGLPEDRVTNTFAVKVAGSGPLAAPATTQIATAVREFYTTMKGAQSATVGSMLYDGLSRVAGSSKIACYDIDGLEQAVYTGGKWRVPPHGSPKHQESFALPAPAFTTALPEEVSCVATLRAAGWDLQQIEAPDDGDADTAVQRPRQRYSGRIFLGPFHATVLSLDATTKKSRVSSGYMDNMGYGLVELHHALETNGHGLAVWSRMDGVLREVTAIQVDNAFDTQRRRGARPTARATYAA